MTDTDKEHGNIEPTITSGDNDHLVTESLLSWAKDVRYVHEIQSMLAQAAEALLSGSIAPSVLSKGAWFTSYLLYILIVVGRKGRTLGMQTTGLRFIEINNSGSSLSKTRRICGTLTALGLGTWVLDWWATKVDRESDSQSDGLRGSDRRRRHELLRQQMLQRSTSSSSSSSQITEMHSNRSQSCQSSSSEGASYRVKFIKKFQSFIKSLVQAMGESIRDGPHNLPTHSDGTPRSISLIHWILRFHLAQYLITGKFPTIIHRVLGLRHQPNNDELGSRVPVKPGTHRVIAFLIALQGSASLIRYFLNWWTNRVAMYLETTNKKHLQKMDKKISPTQSNVSPYPMLSICIICRARRTQPAASSSCGHVFCWPCLNHWVSSVKEACPYCRAVCRLEDIQPLYNYDHLNQSSVPTNQNKVR